MTDTMEITNPLVVAAVDEYNRRAAEVAEIDEKLNVDGGQGALARAAVENFAGAENVSATVTNLVNGLSGADLLAAVTVARRVLNTVSDQVKAYVEANKTEVEELPADVEQALRATRKTAVDAANMMRQAVTMAQPAWAEANLDSVMPALVNKKGAGKGPRAPRLRGAFVWTVDGEFAGNKLADAHKAIGISGPEFKDALIKWYSERGTDLSTEEKVAAFFKDPPSRIEFSYVHGEGDKANEYKVVGRLEESDTESDDEDENYDEPDTESETAESTDDSDLFGN